MIVELRFPAHTNRMSLVRAALRGAAELCGFDSAATHDLVLSACEACQNVIQHGYAGQEIGDIVLSVARRDRDVVISVRDFAPPIDPAKIRPRELTDVRPGGLGTHFIETLMDSVAFSPVAGGAGNLMQMTKRIKVTT